MIITISENNSDTDKTTSNNLLLLGYKWRDYIADKCEIDKSVGNFQILSGNFGLPFSDSRDLFSIADMIPTNSPIGSYSSSSIRRSISYGSLLFSMAPQDGTLFSDMFGDRYIKWVKFRQNYYTNKVNNWSVSQQKLFEVWSKFHMCKESAQHSIALHEKTLTSPLNKAIIAFNKNVNQEHFSGNNKNKFSRYCYSGTINEAKNSLSNDVCINQVYFNSDFKEENNKYSFTKNPPVVDSNFFGVENTGLMSQLNSRAINSKITINGYISNIAELQTEPGAWYDESIEALAYYNPDDSSIWNKKYYAYNWSKYFEQPSGILSRYITSLLLISDFDLTVTINSNFTEVEFNQIKALSVNGIWPFINLNKDPDYINNFIHTDQGFISYRISSNHDTFGILGLKYKLVS